MIIALCCFSQPYLHFLLRRHLLKHSRVLLQDNLMVKGLQEAGWIVMDTDQGQETLITSGAFLLLSMQHGTEVLISTCLTLYLLVLFVRPRPS